MRPVVIIRLFLAGSVVSMLPASAFGDDAFPDAALRLLASEEYKNRIRGQRDLQTWAEDKPDRAAERLLKEHDSTDDPEVRLRLRETLVEVVVAKFQRREGQGYVGIQMDDIKVELPGGDEPRGGVLVTWVHPETPAMRAGLKVNDVVVGLNEVRWPAAIGARESFATEIRRHRPGDKVILEVFREGELKKIEMILAARALGLDEAMRQAWPGGLVPAGEDQEFQERLKRAEKEAKEAYFQRWLAGRRAAADKP